MFRTSILKLLSGPFKVSRLLKQQRYYSIYEPPYLDKGPQPEKYSLLRVRLRGYDHQVLESFSKYIHRIVTKFNVKCDAFATPTRNGLVTLFKPNSNVSAQDYELKLYERTIKMEEIPSNVLPLILELVQYKLPEGVQLALRPHDMEEDDFRFVPNILLLQMRQDVEDSLESIRDYRSR